MEKFWFIFFLDQPNYVETNLLQLVPPLSPADLQLGNSWNNGGRFNSWIDQYVPILNDSNPKTDRTVRQPGKLGGIIKLPSLCCISQGIGLRWVYYLHILNHMVLFGPKLQVWAYGYYKLFTIYYTINLWINYQMGLTILQRFTRGWLSPSYPHLIPIWTSGTVTKWASASWLWRPSPSRKFWIEATLKLAMNTSKANVFLLVQTPLLLLNIIKYLKENI